MSEFEPDGQEFMTLANEDAKPIESAPSLREVIEVNIGLQIDEQNTNSSFLGNQPIRAMEQEVDSVLEDHAMSQDFLESYKTYIPGVGYSKDYEALAQYINNNLSPINPIPLRSDLLKDRDYDLSLKRELYNKVMQNAGTTKALVGGLTGSIIGTAVDPYTIATSLVALPAVGVRTASRAMYTASNFLRGAAFNAVLAVPVEPFIHSWKEEIDAEYSISDSMANVFASGLLGGAVSGIASNLGFKYTGKSFLSKDRDSLYKSFKKLGIEEEDAQVLADFQYEVNNAPDRNIDVEEHVGRLEETQERMNNESSNSEKSEINLENEDLVNKMYDEVPDDFEIHFEDGTKTTFKQFSSELESNLEEVNTVIGCING